MQQRQQNHHRLLLVPRQHHRQRQIVHAAIERLRQSHRNLDRGIAVVALTHVQQPRYPVDVAEFQLVEPIFAAPPLLNKIMLQGEIPAALNFWHYTARLKAAGMTELISVNELLPALGVDRQPPLIGWVFSDQWAASNMSSVQGFLRSLRGAKKILASSNSEWNRLRPLTKAKNEETFVALRDSYRAGIPKSFGDEDVIAAEQLFSTLVKFGGRDLVGDSTTLATGTFWSGFRY